LDILAERNHSAKHFIVYYLIPYFEKIYALNYEDNPDHLSYKSMFITLY
jgi:protoporphyrinogen oxidase